MREKIVSWLGHQFIELSCEGSGEGSVEHETRDIFERCAQRLQERGLDLDHTVRTRLWATCMEHWQPGVEERARVLSGTARSASSSYIRPERFASNARVAIDLLAMRPAEADAKHLVEYDPPGIVLRYLTWERVLFLSGVTVVLPGFDEQLTTVVGRITATLAHAGSCWGRVSRASFFLHRSQQLEDLQSRFQALIKTPIPETEYTFVDTRQGKLIEIEITAES